MKQALIIKKVTIDNDLKVNVLLEFGALGSKDNVFDLISMQGEAVEATFEAAQYEIPMAETAAVISMKK